MYKKISPFILIIFIFSIIFNFSLANVSAQSAFTELQANMQETRTAAGYPATDDKGLESIISKIIKLMLSFIGFIFLLLTIYGGFLWMTARGNDDQITQAKAYIKNGTIGIVIILSAYAITHFVLTSVLKATGG